MLHLLPITIYVYFTSENLAHRFSVDYEKANTHNLLIYLNLCKEKDDNYIGNVGWALNLDRGI